MNMLNFNPSAWRGCLPSRVRLNRMPNFTGMVQAGDSSLGDWTPYVVPSEQQNGGSCSAHGNGNWWEAMIRFGHGRVAIPYGYQLDTDLAYLRARQEFYGDQDLNGGLTIPQGFGGLKLMGWIPDDAEMVEVDRSWEARSEALLMAPLIVGQHLHAGWGDPSPENGCLDHAYTPTVADGYHCTVHLKNVEKDQVKFVVGQNSWGPTWAWNGLYLQSDTEFQRDVMPFGVYTIILPANWLAFDGWKQGLVRDKS